MTNPINQHDLLVYAVVAQSSNVGWTSTRVFAGNDVPSLTQRDTLSVSASFGLAQDALAYGPSDTVDIVNTVTVLIPSKYPAPASVLYADMIAGANLAALRSPQGWELIAFQTVTDLGGGQYQLSNLLRGIRGTEDCSTGHAIGDQFVLLAYGSYSPMIFPIARLNQTAAFKAVTTGESILGIPPVTGVTLQGKNLVPLSPVNFGEAFTLGGSVTLSWDRRSRYPSAQVIGGILPVWEDTTAYLVRIYQDSTYASVIRSAIVNAESYLYTSAAQVADFGSLPATIYFGISQMSAVMGPGTEHRDSVVRP